MKNHRGQHFHIEHRYLQCTKSMPEHSLSLPSIAFLAHCGCSKLFIFRRVCVCNADATVLVQRHDGTSWTFQRAIDLSQSDPLVAEPGGLPIAANGHRKLPPTQ